MDCKQPKICFDLRHTFCVVCTICIKNRMQWLLGTTVGTVLSFKKFRPFWYVRNDIEGHFILQKSISIKE